MIVKRYKQSIVSAQIYNAIKYIIRAPFKNGVKDLKREQKVLDKVTNQVKDMQENWDIKNKEER
ncbi:hypothetical protein GH124_11555 [Staphylococcus pseudintermedius]|nr:hypothetical protein [Staphylococcus pseudintermedius]EGQ3955024.1 hypothetical protein [Staphylococcus pseudintermedius]